MMYNLSRRIWLPLQCSFAWLLGLSEEREREREESRNAPQDSSERFRSAPLATWRLSSRPMRKTCLDCTLLQSEPPPSPPLPSHSRARPSTDLTPWQAFKPTATFGYWTDQLATLGCALLDLVEVSLQARGVDSVATYIILVFKIISCGSASAQEKISKYTYDRREPAVTVVTD